VASSLQKPNNLTSIAPAFANASLEEIKDSVIKMRAERCKTNTQKLAASLGVSKNTACKTIRDLDDIPPLSMAKINAVIRNIRMLIRIEGLGPSFKRNKTSIPPFPLTGLFICRNLKDVKHAIIQHRLTRFEGNVEQTATSLTISQPTVRNWRSRHQSCPTETKDFIEAALESLNRIETSPPSEVPDVSSHDHV